MSALKRLRDRGRRVSEDLDAHYAIRRDFPESPPSRFRPKGVDPSIRAEVWEFLLGLFSPDSNAADRTAQRLSHRAQYAKLKEQCQALDSTVGSGEVVTAPRLHEEENQLRKFRSGLEPTTGNGISSFADAKEKVDESVKGWKLTLHQIGLDVVRTDRMLEFYEKPENLARLWDILAVYAWHDQEIGYCQGMSDLCSPMVVLYPDEADAFWCFERLMSRVRGNFQCTEATVGVQKQLENLALIIKVLDPKLHQHLESLGGASYIFSFRMLMVLFRREFSFADTLYLWEMMWSSEYVPNCCREWKQHRVYQCSGKFGRQTLRLGASKVPGGRAPLSVFCMAAIFVMQRSRLLNETQGLDDVVKLLNDITGKVDAKQACKKAVKLHKHFLLKGAKGSNSRRKFSLDSFRLAGQKSLSRPRAIKDVKRD